MDVASASRIKLVVSYFSPTRRDTRGGILQGDEEVGDEASLSNIISWARDT